MCAGETNSKICDANYYQNLTCEETGIRFTKEALCAGETNPKTRDATSCSQLACEELRIWSIAVAPADDFGDKPAQSYNRSLKKPEPEETGA
jgi:hypothetical protein